MGSLATALPLPINLVSRARRILRTRVYCARRKEGRGKNTSGVYTWIGFCTCVHCRNVGSTNQIAALGNQRKHLNITCTKRTLVLHVLAYIPAMHKNCPSTPDVFSPLLSYWRVQYTACAKYVWPARLLLTTDGGSSPPINRR